jgi:hypothetical protein
VWEIEFAAWEIKIAAWEIEFAVQFLITDGVSYDAQCLRTVTPSEGLED